MFFCAGAVKAGTSWLWQYLRGHPECAVRAVKEVQYFDKLEEGTLGALAQRLRREIAALKAEIEGGDCRNPAWTRELLSAKREILKFVRDEAPRDAEYLAYLTRHAGGRKLVADMTPEYGLLPAERLRDLAALAPDVRFLFVMRDPVQRLWSHVRMLVRRAGATGADFAPACADRFDAVLAGRAPDVTVRGDYRGIVGRLKAAVTPQRLMFAFYETLLTEPGIRDLTRFLGIAEHRPDLGRRMHEGTKLDMTASQRLRAFDWLADQYDFVAGAFGVPAAWDTRAQARLGA